MTRLIALAALLVAAVDASGGYYYAPLGPWGLESTIINAKAIRDADKEIKTTSRKSGGKKKDEVEEVKSEIDDLEAAEEAFFHAVEKVSANQDHACGSSCLLAH